MCEVTHEINRTYYDIVKVGDYKTREVLIMGENPGVAKLVGSLTKCGMHAPAIDIDLPAALMPSKSKDHYHLYIDKEIPWKKYKKMLRAMVRAGIVEKGYYKMSKKRKMTTLTNPFSIIASQGE